VLKVVAFWEPICPEDGEEVTPESTAWNLKIGIKVPEFGIKSPK